MYLKSIEIQGFKSFANKIKFEFHNGITGIVGPNGSGKSNVADAVRWVLGEQRVKQLRGSSMQDVIFAGTQARRPLGFAYVAITLDNSDGALPIDYREVTIARRIYRSGESEYLLNGTVCRLRDVNELFYDTGIGKEGYSIIGQGQIDRILSDKPQDRRALFDEAAGIVKYKHRKEQTLKRLVSEQENLNICAAIEAVLFAAGAPVERERIAQALEITPDEVDSKIAALLDDYNKAQTGITIIRLKNSYQMVSRKEYAPQIRTVMDLRRNTPLSQAALEVLAVVAYNQPVTKAFVEQVRGVDCSGVIGSLTSKDLIEEKGRLELPGRPLLYGTTENFLRCFNISDLENLPPLPESEEKESESKEEPEPKEEQEGELPPE